MKKLILAVIAAAGFNTAVSAGDFNLNSTSVSDLKTSQENLQAVPVPVQSELLGMNKSPNMPAAALDMTIKLPFKSLSSRLSELPGIKMKPLNAAAPILFRQGDHIAFSNVTVDYNGIEVEPTILIKPFFEGENKLAIKVMKVEAEIAFGPKAAFGAQLDKDGLMEMVMNNLTAGMLEAMDKAFAKNKVAMKAKDVLNFTYDRKSWTLRAAVTPGFVAPLLPGLIDNVSLSNFSFDESGFALSVRSGSAGSIAKLPGYNLALSDGLLDSFINQYTTGTDFEFHPKGREGGLKFRPDGRLELAGKIYARDAFGKPNVYFKATILPELTGPNTLKVRIERVDVDQAYGIGIPGFLNNWIQGKVISSLI
ncbi:MAG: hypothetical protein Q8O90_07990, partial [Elusimicrobiota bacterium]|nr:hypothetical protein [Elusimicrobiota bacterium]